MMSSLLPAIYPLLKDSFNLNFAQVGLITLAYQTTASLLQPTIAFYTDKRPRPCSPLVGMGATLIGLIPASAFSVIVVYAQELVPCKVGMISGLCFGFAFGMAGLCAAVPGWLADLTGINFVYLVCSYLPAVGLLAAFLPNIERSRMRAIHEGAIAD